MSATDGKVKWRFSARLDSDDSDSDDSDVSDKERQAVSAKVPREKIRGGELIGLSLRPPQPVETKPPRPIEHIPAHLSCFGIDRKPLKVGAREELEKYKADMAAAEAAAAAKAAPTAAPSTSSLLGTVLSKPTEQTPAAEKNDSAKAPSFSFGAGGGGAATATGVPSQTKPAAPVSFSFGAKPAASAEVPKPTVSFGTAPATSTAAAEPPKVSFSFGTKADKPEPATPAGGSILSRLGSKRSADDDNSEVEPAKDSAASKPLFAFGAATTAAPTETAAAAPLSKASPFGSTLTTEPVKEA
ncbi:hypothetical protein EC988_008363, partial [Linderina pennispora]